MIDAKEAERLIESRQILTFFSIPVVPGNSWDDRYECIPLGQDLGKLFFLVRDKEGGNHEVISKGVYSGMLKRHNIFAFNRKVLRGKYDPILVKLQAIFNLFNIDLTIVY